MMALMALMAVTSGGARESEPNRDGSQDGRGARETPREMSYEFRLGSNHTSTGTHQ